MPFDLIKWLGLVGAGRKSSIWEGVNCDRGLFPTSREIMLTNAAGLVPYYAAYQIRENYSNQHTLSQIFLSPKEASGVLG